MGRDLKRIERIIYKIGKLWTLKPQLRLGQLLFNFGGFNEDINIFNYEDTNLEKELDKAFKKIRREK